MINGTFLKEFSVIRDFFSFFECTVRKSMYGNSFSVTRHGKINLKTIVTDKLLQFTSYNYV